MTGHNGLTLNAHAVQRRVLDRDWTLEDLQEAAALHAYLQQDDACRQVIADYDQLRGALKVSDAIILPGEPEGGWTAMKDRLASSLTHVQNGYRVSSIRRRLRLAAMLALTAGAVVMGYLLGSGGSETPVVQSSPSTGHTMQTVYLPDAVEDRVNVFSEVSAMFDHEAGWIAFTNGHSEMGMASRPVADAQRLLLIRLSLSRAGQLVSQSDVVIIPGQRATLELPLEGGQMVRYHLHVDDQQPALLGLWAEVGRGDEQGRPLAALVTHLQLQPGQIMPAGSMATQSGEYDLVVGFRETARSVHQGGI